VKARTGASVNPLSRRETMALSEKDVLYVAELAHLELTNDEVKRFGPQLDAVLEYVQKLNELDTTGVEPMAQVTYPAAENPTLRDDRAQPCFTQAEALQNAPEPGGGCFKVPQVIERV
jgi:aspartyl-tRNA(Asn)/glutamyl-tRNA(Gln) amidotransferase subunit C